MKDHGNQVRHGAVAKAQDHLVTGEKPGLGGEGIPAAGLGCPLASCTGVALFKRNYELQRHMKKHYNQIFFSPALDCGRWGHDSFYRADKLKDHFTKAHMEDTACGCIMYGCLFISNGKRDLSVHLEQHLDSEAELALETVKHLKACISA